METSEELEYIRILRTEYDRRKSSNALYSLRAFALQLGVDSSQFAKIMSEKILPTLETASKICTSLKLTEQDSKKFMQSLAEEKSCQELYKINPGFTDCERSCEEQSSV